MTSIRPHFKRVNDSDSSFPLAIHRRLKLSNHEYSIDELTFFENQLAALPRNTYDFSLLSRIAATWARLKFNPVKNAQAQALYARALVHHNLQELGVCPLDILVHQAAEFGNLSALQFLFSHPGAFASDVVEDAVFIAVRNGHLNCLQFLLSQPIPISAQCLGRAVIRAAIKGDRVLLELLLRQSTSISAEDLGRALNHAVNNRYGICVELLIRYPVAFFGRDLGMSTITAAKNGDLACLQALLSRLGDIPVDSLGTAILRTVEHRHDVCLERLLNLPIVVPMHRLQAATIRAARHHDLSCLRLLLNYPNLIIRHAHRNQITIDVCAMGSLHSLQIILQKGPISRGARDFAITQASGPDQAAIIDLLNSAQVVDNGIMIELGSRDLGLTFEDVKKDPLEYLGKVIAVGFPNRVVLLNNPYVVDMGGATREFIYVLFQSLTSQLHCSAFKLPVVEKEDRQTQSLYNNLGIFLSLLIQRNIPRRDKFLIGSVFHPKFYQILKITLENEHHDRKYQEVAAILEDIDAELKMLTGVILNPNDEAIENYTDIMGSTPQESIHNYIRAAEGILEGADDHFKDLIKTKSYEELAVIFQGEELSKESLTQALCLESNPRNILQLQMRWIKEKIDSSDLAWRQAFVKMVTGVDVISPSTRIMLKTARRPGLTFEAHTCFTSLELPNRSYTKANFLAGLEVQMSLVESYNWV